MITNQPPTRSKFRTLTGPQRQALIDHLTGWAGTITDLPTAHMIRATIQRTAVRIATGTPTEGPSSDLELLTVAVFLNPARAEIPAVQFTTLQRAWTKLGWTWDWAEDYLTQTRAAQVQVLAILGIPFCPHCGGILRVAEQAPEGPITHPCENPDCPDKRPEIKDPPLDRGMVRRVLAEVPAPIGPQIREGYDVRAWLDKAITWAESLPGALECLGTPRCHGAPNLPHEHVPACPMHGPKPSGHSAWGETDPCPGFESSGEGCGPVCRICGQAHGPVPPAPRPLDQATIRRVLDVMSRAGIQVGTADPAVYPAAWDEVFRRIWAQVALDAEGSAEIVHVTWDKT